jgi:hypothetical protein
MPVYLTCSTCQRIFPRDRGDVHPEHNYCSPTCRWNHPPYPLELTPDGACALVPLRGRGGTIRAYAVIDASDVDIAARWHWSLSSTGYAHRNAWAGGRRFTVSLHREILGLASGDPREGDHIDRDRLNNRRSNLRIATRAQGGQNQPSRTGSSSQYRGVSYRKETGKWRARVCSNRKTLYAGVFETEIEAANAVREARLRLLPFAVD